MLVGDILLSAREAVPDLPGTLPAPGQNDFTVTAAGGGLLAAGAYYLQATYATLWGETAPGPEIPVTLGAGQGAIAVATAGAPYLPLATAVNIYLGTASGAEVFRYNFPAPATGAWPATLLLTGAVGAYTFATPPQGNTAFLPDSGGAVASVTQIYRWLNECLSAIANANGGMPDTSGFATTQGQNNYAVPGDWKHISAAWFDGYPVMPATSRSVFRHNAVSGPTGQMSYVQVGETVICELWPQPNRTGGSAVLSSAMAATDTTAVTAALAGFVLPLGLVGIGGGANYEIASYAAISGANLTQLVRGLGGTNAQAWPAGTPVRELNLMFNGFRAPQLYFPGMAANTIRIPSDWTPYLHMYLLARYRRIEQQEQEATALMREFDAYLAKATKRKPVLGDRQIDPIDTLSAEVYPGLSRTFGGILIP